MNLPKNFYYAALATVLSVASSCNPEKAKENTAENKTDSSQEVHTMLMRYDGCSTGDYFHLMFQPVEKNDKGEFIGEEMMDFGMSDNKLGDFEMLANEDGSDKEYINKYFRVTWTVKPAMFMDPATEKEISEDRTTIISIKRDAAADSIVIVGDGETDEEE